MSGGGGAGAGNAERAGGSFGRGFEGGGPDGGMALE